MENLYSVIKKLDTSKTKENYKKLQPTDVENRQGLTSAEIRRAVREKMKRDFLISQAKL
jgi:hypothetical protein